MSINRKIFFSIRILTVLESVIQPRLLFDFGKLKIFDCLEYAAFPCKPHNLL